MLLAEQDVGLIGPRRAAVDGGSDENPAPCRIVVERDLPDDPFGNVALAPQQGGGVEITLPPVRDDPFPQARELVEKGKIDWHERSGIAKGRSTVMTRTVNA